MARSVDTIVDEAIAESAHPLEGASDDYEPFFSLIGNARFILLGEATHGTHEFYAERARITRGLIERFGFSAVAVEADWPDAYRVNRYVRGQNRDRNGQDALGGFLRFPTWMWRNTDVLAFVEWLRNHNDSQRCHGKVGFYGLDLYSLYTSIDAVLHYLDHADPEAARRARARYACFDHFGADSERYAYATAFGTSQSCEDEVIAQLAEMQRRGIPPGEGLAGDASDEHFYAMQNARLVQNAEEYYRTMFRGRVSSWNLRDRHMAETLEALDAHLSRGRAAKIVVWEHNSHVGDARATQMGAIGEWTVGQLVRERYNAESMLVGFTTHRGTVIAASDWGGPAERKHVRPALADSYEDLFHRASVGRFLLPLRGDNPAIRGLLATRLERAIGVVYLPESERTSHYFDARLPRQFDAVIHCDETSALEPLEPVGTTAQEPTREAPEAYPTSL
ncbi:MAG TPA: erythromycin esterase family protein [Casimicrobiaceae bacterium]|jgi:erythromycin esterase-like protein